MSGVEKCFGLFFNTSKLRKVNVSFALKIIHRIVNFKHILENFFIMGTRLRWEA